MVEQFNVYLATKYSKTLSFSGCRSPSTGTPQLLLSSICLPHQTSADRNWPCPWAKPGTVIPPITGVLTSTGTILRLISHLWGIFLVPCRFFSVFSWTKGRGPALRTCSDPCGDPRAPWARPRAETRKGASRSVGYNQWSVGVGPAAPPPPSLALIKNHNYGRI